MLNQFPRFYPILDVATLAAKSLPPAEFARAVLDAGARILQYRDKGGFCRASFEEARRLSALCREAGVMFIINDRADVAALLGAGLHLGQEDLPVDRARRILGEGPLLGLSTHNEHQLRQGEQSSADYLGIGPVFATATKERPDAVLGLEELRRLRPFSSKPLVAIGGIRLETARQVLEAGANSVAVISGLLPERPDRDSVRRLARQWVDLLHA